MNYLKWLVLVVSIFSLQACKHPLAIIGEGDIIEVSGAAYGCTLEQHRARDSACTENEISGDYFVNYRAVPRPGWRFVRWEGPCAPDSDFQHCRIGVAKSLVDMWDEMHPGMSSAPSAAVFQRISGNTGYLIGPGSPVAGVSYQTATQSGVTGLDGSFQYAEGESIQFSVGDTVLGETEARAQVSPFDLAGASVITETPRIKRALSNENSPFQTVVNVSVLLSSLDHDADPENGIEIRQGTAELLDEVNLDVARHWTRFSNEFALRQAIKQANTRELFSVPHGIIKPALALQVLYEFLGINGRTLAVSMSQEAGQPLVSYRYDGRGNLRRVTVPDGYVEGIPAERYTLQEYRYSQWGHRTRFEQQSYYEEEVEVFDVPHLDSGFSIDIETRRYNTTGNVTRIEWERAADTRFEEADTPREPYNLRVSKTQVLKYRYGLKGELLEVESDYSASTLIGEIDNIVRYEYDREGRVTAITMNGIGLSETAEALGVPGIVMLYLANTHESTYSVSNEYGADGKLRRDVREGTRFNYGSRTETRIYNRDGRVSWYEGRSALFGDSPEDTPQEGLVTHEYEYDEHGNVVRNIIDHGGDGTPDIVETWYYEFDQRGKVTRREFDADVDGVPIEVTLWEYDNQGNVLRREVMLNEDGAPAEIIRWEYDADGYLVRKWGSGDDIRYQHRPTGWGHVFSSGPLQNPTAW